MTLKDVVALTKAGYSKKEIDELNKVESAEVENDLQSSVDSLKKTLDDTIKTLNKSAINQTLTDDKESVTSKLDDVQEALKTLMLGDGGAENGGEKENKA